MPKNITLQNSFIRGLVTEATGLNFPENAATATENCIFGLIGDVTRRLGIDYEENHASIPTGVNNQAISTFRWINAGGDGGSEILVMQVGLNLLFLLSSAATVSSPLSHVLLPGAVSINQFQEGAGPVQITECQYATGNGYLFVYHPLCDPFYCTYNPATPNASIQATRINVQIRDTLGFYPEPGSPTIQTRPTSLTLEHQYNLQNQGWTGTPQWSATSTTHNLVVNPATLTGANIIEPNSGSNTFTVASGIPNVTNGQLVTLTWSSVAVYKNLITGSSANSIAPGTATGTVVSYSGTSLVLDVLTINGAQLSTEQAWIPQPGGLPTYTTLPTWTITPGVSNNTLTTFKTDTGFYPANSDIWYTFKDDTGTFDPSTTYPSVGLSTTPAPRGYYVYNAFNQTKTKTSGISGLTDLSCPARPSNGAWFQGRVWFAGVNGAQAATGDQNFYTWSENIYFSQIILPGDVNSFGNCYQQNDPTDEKLFDILQTDGGVITIQGCGNIYKLFPIQNGMLVFAANGIWFITGSQGIGFTAIDYTITKISSVKSISSTSFIDVLGLPMFWNEEGIYRVVTGKTQGMGLEVEPLTIGTILQFYQGLPLDSKVYARGDYDPINYVVKWVYRSTQENGIGNRYIYDRVLNFNIFNKAFYPYTISELPGGQTPSVTGLFYMNYPNSIQAPDPGFKYIAVLDDVSFAEENSETYLDWASANPQNYTSFFTTGYNLHGKGVFKWNPIYAYVYSRNTDPWAYTIQGVWDFSVSPNSGRQTSVQTVINGLGQPNFGMAYRRHKIRGHGESLQLTISSVQGQPFDIMGWALLESIDGGV